MIVKFITAVVFSTLLIMTPSKSYAAPEKKTDIYQLLNLFGDVFERTRHDYVEEIGEEKLIEAALNGMLSSLDPHSSYLSEKAFTDMQVQTSGQFGGLGIEVTMESGYVKVISPIDETPAYRAGLKPGDFITHLDEKPVLGLSLSQAVDKMRGKIGTKIKLTIRRQGKPPFEVTITRAIIKIRSVRSRSEDNIGYIRITSFNENTDTGVKKAITTIQEENKDKLLGFVLDLRNNPGGLLDQAIAVSDIFLEQGEIVSTRSRKADDTQRYNAHKGDLAKKLPVVVLINDGSASASEIVAGALQDHNRAILLGTKSFGKGSVQTIMPLPGHGAMRITTARYYTPSGRSIQAKGIVPDIEVKPAHVEYYASNYKRSEASLRNALINTDENKKDDKKDEKANDVNKSSEDEVIADEESDDKKTEDYQLIRAFDLIRGLSLYGKQLTNG